MSPPVVALVLLLSVLVFPAWLVGFDWLPAGDPFDGEA